MIINLYYVAAWLTALGVIAGVLAAVYKVISKHLKRVGNIESWNGKQQQDIENITAQDVLKLRALLACLKGLEQQGCNGPVTESIKELEDYLFKRMSDTVSSLGGRNER